MTTQLFKTYTFYYYEKRSFTYAQDDTTLCHTERSEVS